MTPKHPENKRQAKVERMAENATKPQRQSKKKDNSSNKESGLMEQYRIIKDDIVKLKDDINTGYAMAKGMMDKGTWRQSIKDVLSK
jgi:hypothetical protein